MINQVLKFSLIYVRELALPVVSCFGFTGIVNRFNYGLVNTRNLLGYERSMNCVVNNPIWLRNKSRISSIRICLELLI